jgi:SAM-dependent methyltransferase
MKNGKTEKFPLVQRVEYLKKLSAGKKILHLGCADYPFTEESIRNRTHLHLKLAGIGSELYGFDYDQAGIDVLRSHGFDKLYHADLERLEDVTLDEKFEIIIAGEIIEHLSNPGLFLRGIKRFMKPDTNLVITTINAFGGYRYWTYGLKGRGGSNEPVHPDHVSYYSYSTLKLVLEREKLKLNKFAFYDVGTNHRPLMNWRQRIINDISVRISPLWADGIIAESSLNDDER